jgi:RNA-directed DNA polymerase
MGTPQGAVISPLLAHVYLHYVLDRWVREWRQRHARGEVIVVRYADDTVIGFEPRTEAVRFLADLETRMAEYALALHPDKTRLIEFGRFAAANRKAGGLGKPETFDFFGFTHICGRTRKGRFQVRRRSRRDWMRAKLQAIKAELRRRMPAPAAEQGKWLASVVLGYFQPWRAQQRGGFGRLPPPCHRSLARRSSSAQRQGPNHMGPDQSPRSVVVARPRICHPWPQSTLRRHSPEVGAVCGKAARTVLCGGHAVMRVPTATVAQAAPRNDRASQ